jgi:hypothetical protein
MPVGGTPWQNGGARREAKAALIRSACDDIDILLKSKPRNITTEFITKLGMFLLSNRCPEMRLRPFMHQLPAPQDQT